MRTSRYIAVDICSTSLLVIGTFLLLQARSALSFDQMQTRQSATMTTEQQQSTAIPEGAVAPAVGLELLRDPKIGWNLHLIAPHFVFAFDSPKEPDSLPGYASLYVDGKYRGRLYSLWTNLPALDSGEHILSVMLLDPQFRVYRRGDAAIASTLTVDIGADNTLRVL